MKYFEYPVVIMCGGRGTRLGEVTGGSIPKPMVRIGNLPIVLHIINSYVSQGFSKFILCTGHLSEVLNHYFSSVYPYLGDIRVAHNGSIERLGGEHHGAQIDLIFTGEDTNTAGRLNRIAKYLTDEFFYLTYGDGLSDVQHRKVFEKLEDTNSLCAVTGVSQNGRFGSLKCSGDRVVEFNEKTPGEHIINGGFMCFRREFLDKYKVHMRDDVMLEREPLTQCAIDGKLRVHQHHGFWQCMDGPRDYELLSRLYSSESGAPWIND